MCTTYQYQVPMTFTDSMGQIYCIIPTSVVISIDKHLTFDEAKTYGTQIAKTITAGLPAPSSGVVFEFTRKNLIIAKSVSGKAYQFEDPDKGVIKAKQILKPSAEIKNMTKQNTNYMP